MSLLHVHSPFVVIMYDIRYIQPNVAWYLGTGRVKGVPILTVFFGRRGRVKSIFTSYTRKCQCTFCEYTFEGRGRMI